MQRKTNQSSDLAYLRLGALASAIVTAIGASNVALGQNNALEEVTVTGSRIVRRDFVANSPIMTVDEEFFENSSTVGIETVLNQLPQFVPAVTQFTTDVIQSTATQTPGASTLSLRGLGANRNLVLLDGRRAMPVNASGAVDINMIPAAAIQRVETITGGASSVYGADAMAGVVNFILKRDYEGVDIDTQFSTTMDGGGTERRINGLFGANVAGGQGNVMLGFDVSQREPVYTRDREFFTRGWADPTISGTEFQITDTYYSTQGGNRPDQAVVDAIFDEVPAGSVTNSSNFYINPSDDTLYKSQAPGNYRLDMSTLISPDGYVYRKFRASDGALQQNQLDDLISIPLDRTSMFGRGRFDFSDTVSAFAQATYSKNDNETVQYLSPAIGVWGGSVPHGDEIYAPSLNADGTTSADYLPGGRIGVNCAPMGGCTNSEVWPTPPELTALLDSRPDPNADWNPNHTLWWAGPRTTQNQTTSYQLVFGLEGSLSNSDMTWELYASKGQTQVASQFFAFASLERYRAVLAAPNYGRGFFFQGNPQGNNFGAGLATCTSGLPIIEQIVPTQDCIDAITARLQNASLMEQEVVEGNIQGHLADMPAGEARFAAGVSYRKNDYNYTTDVLTSQGSFLDSTIGLFPNSNSAGDVTANDIYGELLIPLIGGKRGIDSLNLELGYRYSDNDPVGSVDTWKALFDWNVNERLRFRGGYQVANRAPNIGELYLSRTQTWTFSPGGDFCSEANPFNPLSANPALNPDAAEVRALCEQLMGPAGAAEYYSGDQPDAAASFVFVNLTGNPKLKSENADTWTLGAVISPSDRLSLTVDWYEIEITDMIAAQTGQAVYTDCLSRSSNPTFDPNYVGCQGILRNPVTGNGGPIDVNYNNEGAIKTSGLDIQVNWNKEVGNGSLNVSSQVTYLDSVETQVTPAADKYEWVGTFGPVDLTGVDGGSFRYRTYTTLSYNDNRGWNTSLAWRFLPSLDSAASVVSPTDTTRPTGDYHVFDLRGGYRFGPGGRWLFRAGIDNLFDAQPEITQHTDDSTGAGQTDRSFYDVLGRRYYLGLKVEF